MEHSQLFSHNTIKKFSQRIRWIKVKLEVCREQQNNRDFEQIKIEEFYEVVGFKMWESWWIYIGKKSGKMYGIVLGIMEDGD